MTKKRLVIVLVTLLTLVTTVPMASAWLLEIRDCDSPDIVNIHRLPPLARLTTDAEHGLDHYDWGIDAGWNYPGNYVIQGTSDFSKLPGFNEFRNEEQKLNLAEENSCFQMDSPNIRYWLRDPCNSGLIGCHVKPRGTGLYGYHILYLSESHDDVRIHVTGKTSGNSDLRFGAVQVHIFNITHTAQDPIFQGAPIGPLQTITNGRVGIKYRTTQQQTSSSPMALSPGAYLVVYHHMFHSISDQSTSFYSGANYHIQGLDVNNQDEEWHLLNYYEADWYNKWHDLDENVGLCNRYYGANGQEGYWGHITSLEDYPEDVLDERRCCGNNAGDIGYAIGDFVCTDNGWKAMGPADFCAELGGQTPFSDGSYVFLEFIGATSQDITNIQDGRDACCGDDRPQTHFFEPFDNNEAGWEFISSNPTPRIQDGKLRSGASTQTPTYHLQAALTLPVDTTSNQIEYFTLKADYESEAVPGTNVDMLVWFFFRDSQGTTIDLQEYVNDFDLSSNCVSFIEDSDATDRITISRGNFASGDTCTFGVPRNLLLQTNDMRTYFWLRNDNQHSEITLDNVHIEGIFSTNDNRIEFSSGDLGFVMEELGSDGLREGRYLCTDAFNNVFDNDIVYRMSGLWNWFPATKNPFTIHKLPGADHISNSQEWFYCDAYGRSEYRAHAVDNLASFTDALAVGTNLCPGSSIPNDLEIEPISVNGVVYDLSNYVMTTEQYCYQGVFSTNDWNAHINSYVVQYSEIYGGDGLDLNNNWQEHIIGCCVARTGDTQPPHLGWDLFTSIADQNTCPQECWNIHDERTVDDDDPSDPSENSGGNFDDIPKDELDDDESPNIIYSDPISPDQCQIRGNQAGLSAEICSGGQTCIPDSSIQGSQAIFITGGIDMCCIAGTCVYPQDLTCEQLAGNNNYVIYETENNYIDCRGIEYVGGVSVNLPAGQACCVGSYTWNEEDIQIRTIRNESFVCYKGPQSQGVFAECCSGTNCMNTPIALGESLYVDGGNIFGRGSQLHTIRSFDRTRSEGGLVDHVRRYTLLPSGQDAPAYKEMNENLNQIQIPIEWRDMSEYDTLTFDIKWSGKYKPHNITFIDSQNNMLDIIHISDKAVIPSLKENLWHRVTIPIPEDADDVRSLYFTLKKLTDQEVSTVYYVDNFVLHKDNEDYQNYYCSGEFYSWLPDLVASPGTDGVYRFEDYAPQWYACDAQLSFKWTGTACCGANSTKYDMSDRLLAEYYTDSWSACWGGVSIPSDTAVWSVFDDPQYDPHILYYQGEFHSCNITETINDGKNNPIDLTGVEDFTIIGSWYCSQGNDGPIWRHTRNLPRTRLLMSKMNELAQDDDYTLHCDETGLPTDRTLAVNNALGNMPQAAGNPLQSESYCVLRILENDVTEQVVVGAVLDMGVDVNNFLQSNIRAFYPYQDTERYNINCSRTIGGGLMPSVIESPENFFTACSVEITSLPESEDPQIGFHVYYNKPLNLIYMSASDVEVGGGFFIEVWQAIIDFFRRLFGGGSDEDEGVVMPSIGLADFVYEADFQHAYLMRSGDKQVRGIVERIGQPSGNNEYADLNYRRHMRVDYLNFSTDISLLKDFVTRSDEHFNSFNTYYCAHDTQQTIFVDMPAGVFFDWRYITSALRVQDGGNPFTASGGDVSCYLHNGRIDFTEECDDTYEEYGSIIVINETYQDDWDSNERSLECLHVAGYEGSTGVITSCHNGRLDITQCYEDYNYTLFMSSTTHTGAMGGISGADYTCQQLARSLSKEGFEYYDEQSFALLSYVDIQGIPQHAKDRFSRSNAKVLNTQGQVLDDSVNALFNPSSPLQQDIYTENQEMVISHVWTASNTTGHVYRPDSNYHCQQWTSSTSGQQSTRGLSNNKNNNLWLYNSNVMACSNHNRIYCVTPTRAQPVV